MRQKNSPTKCTGTVLSSITKHRVRFLAFLAFSLGLFSCNPDSWNPWDIDISNPPEDPVEDPPAGPSNDEIGCPSDVLNAMEEVVSTSFDSAEKLNDNNLSWDFPHWFEFAAMHQADGGSGDGLGGAHMWVDSEHFRSGGRSIGMEVFDIEKSRRAEFVLIPNSIVGKEYCVSYWVYLPENWGLYDPTINWDWFEIGNPYSAGGAPYSAIYIGSPDENQQFFSVWLGGRNKEGEMFGTSRKRMVLPKGRWFQVSYYVKRDTKDGEVKVWFDDELIGERSGFPTVDPNNSKFTISIAKIYHERGDKTPHKMWIDDLTIYSSKEKN